MSSKNLMSVAQYAKKCKVSVTVIYNRINSGEVKTTSEPGYFGKLIDVSKFPPVPKKRNGRKAYKN